MQWYTQKIFLQTPRFPVIKYCFSTGGTNVFNTKGEGGKHVKIGCLFLTYDSRKSHHTHLSVRQIMVRVRLLAPIWPG